jgi:uncharacterized protein YjiS (DUF1127 family)
MLTSEAAPRAGRLAIRKSDQAGRSWLDWLEQALRAVSTRRYLTEMDDRMLRDIGISRTEAFEEANRAPWDFETTSGPRGV